MKHDVFLCYTAIDKPIAECVLRGLTDRKIRCYDPFSDTTLGGNVFAESLAALSSSKAVLCIFTGEAGKDSSLTKQLDAAGKAGIAIVALCLSENPPPLQAWVCSASLYTVAAREEAGAASFEELFEKIVELVAAAREKEGLQSQNDVVRTRKFSLPGFNSGKWWISLIAMLIYVLSSAVILISFFLLGNSERLLEDLMILLCFVALILVPVLLLGNFMGLRDLLPVLRRRKPLSTGLFIIITEGLIFLSFDLIFFFMERAG